MANKNIQQSNNLEKTKEIITAVNANQKKKRNKINVIHGVHKKCIRVHKKYWTAVYGIKKKIVLLKINSEGEN